MKNFTIDIATVPDRVNLVAEIWFYDVLIAEIDQEDKDFSITFFQPASSPRLLFDDFLQVLQTAKAKLIQSS